MPVERQPKSISTRRVFNLGPNQRLGPFGVEGTFRSGLNHPIAAPASKSHAETKELGQPYLSSYRRIREKSQAFKVETIAKQKQKRRRKHVDHATRVSLFIAVTGTNIDSLPEDVVFEVFKYLDYPTLLIMYKVNKRFQVYLASSKANQDWDEAAERPKGLPKCPPDMTGGAFAILMTLDSRCRGCGHDRTRKQIIKNFHLRAQYCRDCYKLLVKNNVEKVDAWVMRQKFGGVRIITLIPKDIIDKIVNWASWDKYKEVKDPKSKKPKEVILPLSDVSNYFFSCSLAEKMFASYILTKAQAEDEFMVGKAKDDALKDWLDWEAMQEELAGCRNLTGHTMYKYANKHRQKAEEKRARLESAAKKQRIQWVEKNLVEKHKCDPRNFPKHNPKWRQLVHNSHPTQALTDSLWKTIWPTLEPLIAERRIERIRQEKRARRRQITHEGKHQVKLYLQEHNDIPEAIRSGPTDDAFLSIPVCKAYYVNEDATSVDWQSARDVVLDKVITWFVENSRI
ncbi:hypothetical protein FRB94_014478 [Tulasnella sp. JGI-2019a]|nr:hypothetical protein FRB94_014478 [Tulasnella sp. JGI-2019a]